MNGVSLVELPIYGDERGDLVVVEGNRSIPFDIKRVYTIFHTSYHMVRGCHAHVGMKQFIMNVTGSYALTIDDGNTRQILRFNEPGNGVLIDGFVWRELSEFSPGSVINCFTNKYYDESVYISDYQQFLDKVAAR